VRIKTLLTAALVAGLLTGCGSPVAHPTSTPSQVALHDAEAKIVALLATSRAEAGLSELTRDPALDAVARSWSGELADTGQLEHNPAYARQIPDGWSESGENVGWIDPAEHSLADLPADLSQAWLDSPTHRANIEDPSYTAVGVGIAYDPDHGYYVTQDFAAYPE
jgi:uncharacterized protein YkwD